MKVFQSKIKDLTNRIFNGIKSEIDNHEDYIDLANIECYDGVYWTYDDNQEEIEKCPFVSCVECDDYQTPISGYVISLYKENGIYQMMVVGSESHTTSGHYLSDCHNLADMANLLDTLLDRYQQDNSNELVLKA